MKPNATRFRCRILTSAGSLALALTVLSPSQGGAETLQRQGIQGVPQNSFQQGGVANQQATGNKALQDASKQNSLTQKPAGLAKQQEMQQQMKPASGAARGASEAQQNAKLNSQQPARDGQTSQSSKADSASASSTLQNMQLQNQMQRQNRAYTATSNMMKTKQDTTNSIVKNIK